MSVETTKDSPPDSPLEHLEALKKEVSSRYPHIKSLSPIFHLVQQALSADDYVAALDLLDQLEEILDVELYI